MVRRMDTDTTTRPRLIHVLSVGSLVQVLSKRTDGEGVHHEVSTIECASPEQAVAVARFYEAIG